jgi:hypothetical protein
MKHTKKAQLGLIKKMQQIISEISFKSETPEILELVVDAHTLIDELKKEIVEK